MLEGDGLKHLVNLRRVDLRDDVVVARDDVGAGDRLQIGNLREQTLGLPGGGLHHDERVDHRQCGTLWRTTKAFARRHRLRRELLRWNGGRTNRWTRSARLADRFGQRVRHRLEHRLGRLRRVDADESIGSRSSSRS